MRGEPEDIGQRLPRESVSVLDDGGRTVLTLRNLLLHELQRSQRAAEGLRQRDRLRGLSERGGNRLLADLRYLLKQVALRVVRQLHGRKTPRRRGTNDLTQPCEHARQLLGFAAAARAQLRPEDRSSRCNSEISLGKHGGKAHLEAPVGGISGEIRR